MKRAEASALGWLPLVFLTLVLIAYLGTIFFFEGLQGAPQWDEKRFWETSLIFSDDLIPTLQELRNYGELNTPLPFIVYGAVEHLFGGGIFVGRLLNLALSFLMICLILFAARERGLDPILAASGLLLFPYHVYYSALLYTDTFAAFFVLLGLHFYVRERHLLSGLFFVLAIASRQYMLAFPLAIVAFELAPFLRGGFRVRLRWVAPLVAASSMLGWIWLFGGLAPAPGPAVARWVPAIQASPWALAPATPLYILACLGLYFVIPELVLFPRKIHSEGDADPQEGRAGTRLTRAVRPLPSRLGARHPG